MRRLFSYFALVFFLSFSLLSCQAAVQDTALVTRVVDGDTVVLESGERVRYIGMDTPEIGQRYYEEAKRANEELVLGKRIRLEKDVSETDRYKRLLRYAYADSVFVNGELVKRGLARAKAYPPDTRHQKELEALEKQAIIEGRGLWSLKPVLSGAEKN